MRKAVAVFDEPKSCHKCPLSRVVDMLGARVCGLSRKTYYGVPSYHRPSDCPLHVQGEEVKEDEP